MLFEIYGGGGPARKTITGRENMAEEAILGFLKNNEEITDSGQFSSEHNLDHNDVVNVIKSLHGFQYIVAQVPPLCPSSQLKSKLNFVYGEGDSGIYMLFIVRFFV